MDEIVSKLGFSCADAITELTKMDDKMAALEGHFGSLGQAMTAWNSSAAATITNLKDIASAANAAAAAMGKLNANMNKQGGGQQPAAPPPQVKPSLILPPGVREEMDAIGRSGKIAGESIVDGFKPVSPVIDDAGKKAGGFTISLQMLSRIVITQAIVRAISGIRDALSEAITTNMDFVKHISELNSIMGGPRDALDGLSSSVAQMSKEFNFPIAQVAEAQYQAVSAQFVTTAQRADVMSAAMKLAKIGVMDLNTSVNLITGTLNSYGLSSSQSEQVAAKFFQTIKDGRVRGEELAASLGKVMPIAAELGVSLDQVNAAMVQLTVAGVKPAEAATSLRSAINALVKPSQDLKKEMLELGFDSGEQMIAAYGLQGALEKLRGSTDGTIAAMVKLIPNIRAQNTVLRETADHATNARAELERMRQATASSMNQAYRIFIDTNAEKVSADLNKLQVWLTTELGPALLKSVASVVAWTGGIGTLTSAISALAAPVAIAVAGLVAWIAYSKLAELRAAQLAGQFTAVGSAASIASAALAVWAAYNFGKEKLKADLDSALQEFDTVAKKIVDAKDEARRKVLAIQDQENEAVVQKANQLAAEISKSYHAQVDAAKTSSQSFSADIKGTMESMLAAKEKGVHLLRDLVNESEKEIQNSLKRTVELTGELSDTKFNYGQKESQLNPQTKAIQDRQRAEELASKGAKSLGSAQTPEEESAAQAVLKRAESYAKAAMSAAEVSGSLGLQRQAEDTIEGIIQKRLKAEQELRALKAATAQEAAAAAAKEQQQANEMRVLLKKIMEETNLFDKQGNPLSDKKRQANAAQAQTDLNAFQEKAFSTGNWDMSQLINFDAMRRKMTETMTGAVTGVQISELQAAPATLQKLNEQITKGVGVIKLYAQLAPGVDFAGMNEQESRAAALKNVADKRKGANDWKQALADVSKGYDEIAVQIQKIKGLGEVVDTPAVARYRQIGALTNVSVDPNDALRERAKLHSDIQFAAEHSAATTPDQMADLASRAKNFVANAPNGFSYDAEAITTEMDALKKVLDLMDMIKAKKNEADSKDDSAQSGQRLQQFDASAPVRSLDDMSTRAAKVKQLLDSTADETMPSFIGQIVQAVSQMENLATASQQVQSPSDSTPAYANGGAVWNFLAGGGTPRGTDTIHAMLSPGEMVINAKSARNFGAQLSAMNAGMKPSYHSQGGSITNVGDINVNVAGGGSARNTGRTIATEIRRELRRGSSSLS